MDIVPLIDPYALRQDGSKKLTANWDAGAYTITAEQLTSTDDITAGDSFFASVGAGGSPAYSFTDYPTAGMYYISSGDRLRFATEGVSRLSLNDTQAVFTVPILVPDGSVGAPGFAFADGTNTGIYRVAGGYGVHITNANNLIAKFGDTYNIDFYRSLDLNDENITGTGYIKPDDNNLDDLGDLTHRFRSLYLGTNLTDGTNSLTIANAKAAYDHVSNDGTDHSLLGATAGTATASLALIVDASKDIDMDGGDIFTTGSFTTTAGLYTNQFVAYGDTDTYVSMVTPDRLLFAAGGVQFIDCLEGDKNDNLNFSLSTEDINIKMSANGAANLFNLDGGNATISIGDGGITNYSQFSAVGNYTLYGNAKVTNAVWVGANAVKAPPTKAADFIDHGISGAWEFSDATDDTIVANMRIPYRMDRSVAPTLTISWSSTTQSADCEWQVEYLWRAADEDTTAAADDTLLASTDADAYTSSATAEGMVLTTFTLAAPSATDACLHLRIKRRADLAGDTINGDTTELHGICMSFTSNKLGLAA